MNFFQELYNLPNIQLWVHHPEALGITVLILVAYLAVIIYAITGFRD